jgi:hypothetical protein
VQARLVELERLAEGIPLSLHAWYEVIGAVNFVDIPPFHWPLPPWREGLRRFFEEHVDTPEWIVTEQWQEAEARNSVFGTACQQFIEAHPRYPQYTRDELRQFAVAHPGFLSELPHVCTWIDPRQVHSLEDQSLSEELTLYHQWEARYGEAPDFDRTILIAGDPLSKYYISGGGPYQIVVPCRAADAALDHEWHNTTFVNYLRICFRWGGMPGLKQYPNPPQEDVAYLTHDLLRI